MRSRTLTPETRDLVSETEALLQALPDLIFRFDREGNFLDVKQSPHIPLLLDPEQVLQHNIREVTPPQLAEGTLRGIEETRRSGRPAIFHYQLDFDGEQRDFEARIVRIGDSDEYLGIVRDISEQQRALRQLGENETRYRALFERANDAVFLVREGLIIDCNAKALEMFCCQKEDLLGVSPLDISPDRQPDGRSSKEEALAILQRAMQGEAQRFEWQHRRFDGTLFDCEISISRIDLPDGPLIQGIIHDITRRRLAQRALEESNRLLEQVFANDFTQMAYLDTAFHYIRVNPAFARASNRTPDAFIGRNFFDDCDDPLHRERFTEVVRTGRPHTERARADRPASDPDGRFWDWSLQAVRDAEGSIIGLVYVRMDVTERLQNERQLREAAQELDRILHNMQDTYYRIDANGILTRVSDSVQQLLGYTPEEVIGRPMVEFYAHPGEREALLKRMEANGGRISNNETALRHRDGSVVWTSSNAHFIYEENGELAGVEGTARDITERKLQESQVSKLSSVLEQTADIVIVTDIEGIIEYVNPSFERVTGYRFEEAVGRKPSILSSGKHKPEFFQHLWKTILAGESYTNILINRRKDGSLYYEEKTITPIRDQSGRITHFVSTAKDISERMQVQERLQHMAHHDTLTDLPNRNLFLDRLQQALIRARHHQRLVAVMFLDLDRFKNINDTLGHSTGDQLLLQLSERLKRSVRDGDTIARFGGDEFAILLDDVDSENSIATVAQKLLHTLTEPFHINNHELFVTASIGIAIFPHDGEDPDTLLRNADVAMYRAKELGKNNYQFYSDDMSARNFERLTLENHLRHALAREQFILHYQPQVDARNDRIVGVEALLRWQHPELGLVSPSNFISLLEETGLIEEVGEWVLEAACRQSRAWHDAGWGDLRLSVNISSRQFNNSEFIDALHGIIDRTGVNPEFLELELTESMLMRQASSVVTALRSLNRLGVRFAIDDFGTGYSSLSYLRRFPIETIKIDRSFIRDITEDADDAAITRAIVVMAQNLSLDVIAEGVESEAQLAFLKENGCHVIQGFHYSPPVSAEALTALLEKQARA